MPTEMAAANSSFAESPTRAAPGPSTVPEPINWFRCSKAPPRANKSALLTNSVILSDVWRQPNGVEGPRGRRRCHEGNEDFDHEPRPALPKPPSTIYNPSDPPEVRQIHAQTRDPC